MKLGATVLLLLATAHLSRAQAIPVASVYNTSSRLVSELLGIFGPGDDREGSKYPLPYGINRALGVPTAQASPSVTKDKQSPVWVDLAKDVIGLLREQTTTTPQPTTTQFSLLSQFQQLLPDFMKSPPPPDSNIRRYPIAPVASPREQNSLFGQWTTLFDRNEPETVVDTGNGAFDRFLVRENVAGTDPFSSLMGGKWNEKGLQWEDGNLRLVNKRGNKLLGSEVAVHDRSVDIPVRKWFDIANSIARSYQNPEVPFMNG
ncbi:hypothetical protein AAVH_13645 [Aphelenchoides avenae]|nr:hypothetical protein AAVH_13645 [Aphelenchus avenae]